MLLSQMAAEAAKDYKYDIILANVNGKLTEISDMDICLLYTSDAADE